MGGVRSAVYATETSVEEYLTYTTEETEKLEVTQMTEKLGGNMEQAIRCLLYTSPSPRDRTRSRMPSSA